ncbi:MAG: diguanylate cyclase domain-containing protein [Aminivibrio sp.]|jgi:GGDEF domain-containing protein
MSAWITLPPLLSVPLAAALFLLGGQTAPVGIGAPFWALLIIIYFIITGVYALAIARGLMRLLTPLQLLGQGMIAAGISLEAGAPQAVSWAGVVIAVSGAIIMLNQFLTLPKTRFGEEGDPDAAYESDRPRESALDGLPLPALTVDSSGMIMEVNGAFAAIAPESQAPGAIITDFLIPGEQTAELGGKQYAVFQAPRGELFFFALVELPARKGGTASSLASGGGVKLQDEGTGLYSPEYAAIRIPEELGRAFRYRRWLSAVMLAVEFIYNPGQNYEQNLEKKFIKAFSGFVKSIIRASDVAFLLDERKILLLLPETPQQGAKEVSIKLKELPEPVEDLINSLPFSVNIKHGFIYYSGNHVLTKDQLLEKVQSEMDKKKE